MVIKGLKETKVIKDSKVSKIVFMHVLHSVNLAFLITVIVNMIAIWNVRRLKTSHENHGKLVIFWFFLEFKKMVFLGTIFMVYRINLFLKLSYTAEGDPSFFLTVHRKF